MRYLQDFWMRGIILDMLYINKQVNPSVESIVTLESGGINFTFGIDWSKIIRGNCTGLLPQILFSIYFFTLNSVKVLLL